MAKRRSINVGDIFEIPLPSGRRAYGQYVFRDRRIGPLIRVYDLIVEGGDVPWTKLSTVGYRFPPILTGLIAAIREGYWNVVGHLPVKEFTYPTFLSVMFDPATRQPVVWYSWDAEGYHRIGPTPPDNYRSLEHLSGWDPSDVARRIETREDPWDKILPTAHTLEGS